MTLIQEAEKLADEIAKQEPNTKIESIIRRLIVELKLRDHLQLKIDRNAEEPEITRIKVKAKKK